MSEKVDITDTIMGLPHVKKVLDHIHSLSAEERKIWTQECVSSLKKWAAMLGGDFSHEIQEGGWLDYAQRDPHEQWKRSKAAVKLLFAAVALDTTARQVLPLWRAGQNSVAFDRQLLRLWIEAMLARGDEWVTTFVQLLLKGPRRELRGAHLLLVPLMEHIDIPVPEQAEYLRGWAIGNLYDYPESSQNLAHPKRKWEEHFIAACAIADALARETIDQERLEKEYASALVEYRENNTLNDGALFSALLQVIARGEKVTAQRNALIWMGVLGVLDAVNTHRSEVIAALALAEPATLKKLTTLLLSKESSEEELYAIAGIVLAAKEKGIKTTMLRALNAASTPPQDIIDAVNAIAESSDVTNAQRAAALLDKWNIKADESTPILGLWNEPSGGDMSPFIDENTLIISENELALRLVEIADEQAFSGDLEIFLAQLVATIHRNGTQVLTNAIAHNVVQEKKSEWSAIPLLLTRLLAAVVRGDITPGQVPPPAGLTSGSLLYLSAWRVRDIFYRLGEIPCLLSTPSVAPFRVTWEDFIRRAERYRDAGVEIEPTDLAVALGRMERSTCANVAGMDLPIRGSEYSLGDILARWRDDIPAEPEIRNYSEKNQIVWRNVLEVTGDQPYWHELIGIESPWTHPYSVSTNWSGLGIHKVSGLWKHDDCRINVWDERAAISLMPQYPARAGLFPLMHIVDWVGSSASADAINAYISTAHRCGNLGIIALFSWVCGVSTRQRDEIAGAVLSAWDEGRITAKELVQGWFSPMWAVIFGEEQLPDYKNRNKIFSFLISMAQGGGLALVWPLMLAMAEEMAGEEKLPAKTAGVLEQILHFLPEVRAAGVSTDMPNISALASRKGKSKAITTARLIAEQIGE